MSNAMFHADPALRQRAAARQADNRYHKDTRINGTGKSNTEKLQVLRGLSPAEATSGRLRAALA
jgi:hypothetical protein